MSRREHVLFENFGFGTTHAAFVDARSIFEAYYQKTAAASMKHMNHFYTGERGERIKGR